MFKFPAVLFCVLFGIVSGSRKRPRDICAGTDVSKDPRLESRQLDGLWYTHRIQTQQRFPPITIFFFQFQGRTFWGNDWNATSQECQYRLIEATQRQSVKLGPFSPCFDTSAILDTGERRSSGEFLFWMPNKDMLMFHQCAAEVRPNGVCTEKPFVRLMTRKIRITRRQLDIFRKKLITLGVFLDSLSVVNIKENRCPLPTKAYSGRFKGGYGIWK